MFIMFILLTNRTLHLIKEEAYINILFFLKNHFDIGFTQVL